jgi:hypothetical protein
MEAFMQIIHWKLKLVKFCKEAYGYLCNKNSPEEPAPCGGDSC